MEQTVVIDSFIDSIEESKKLNKSIHHGFDNVHTRLGSHSIIVDDDDMRGLMQHLLLVERILATRASNKLERKLQEKISSDELFEYVNMLGEPISDDFEQLPENQLRSLMLDRVENISYTEVVNESNISSVNHTHLLTNLGYNNKSISNQEEQASPSPTRNVSIEIITMIISDVAPEINKTLYEEYEELLTAIKPMVRDDRWEEVYKEIDTKLIELDKSARTLTEI